MGNLLAAWGPAAGAAAENADDPTVVTADTRINPPAEEPAAAPATTPGRRLRPVPTLALLSLLAAVALYATDYYGVADVEFHFSPFRAAWTAFVEQGRMVLNR